MKMKKLKFGNIVDTYEIREDGIIINVKRQKEVKPHLDKDGYANISLSTIGENGKPFTKRYRRGVLVNTIFNSAKPSKDSTVNHKDLDKQNDHYTNLEWLTALDNYTHACLNNANPKGFNHGRTNLSKKQLKDICKSLVLGETQSSISKRLGVGASKISKIRNKENWKEFSDKYFILQNGVLKKV